MVKSYTTKNPSQTRKLGEKLAKEILMKKPRTRDFVTVRGRPKKTAFIIGLEGELGGGKTTFLQGFAKGLGIKEKILSPTFVIMKKFTIPLFKHPSKAKGGDERMFIDSKFKHFYHIDCYRIQKPKEILDLGFKKIISDPENIIAIEWADRIKEAMPKNVVMLEFDFINKNTRRITIGAKRKSKRNYRG